MSDPERLLAQEEEGTPLERDVLRAGLDVGPPAEAKQAVWTAILGRTSAGEGGGPGGESPGPSGGPAAREVASANGRVSGIAKAVGVGAAIGLLVMGGAQLSQSGTEPSANTLPSAPRPAAASTTPVAQPSRSAPDPVEPKAQSATRAGGATEPHPRRVPVVATEDTAATAAPSTTAFPIESAGTPNDAAEARRSQLLEESRFLREARAALRGGNPSRALALLDESRRKHPRPMLGQEHEALTIEALASSGARAAARDRAKAFVARFPSSPHSTKLRSIAGSP